MRRSDEHISNMMNCEDDPQFQGHASILAIQINQNSLLAQKGVYFLKVELRLLSIQRCYQVKK